MRFYITSDLRLLCCSIYQSLNYQKFSDSACLGISCFTMAFGAISNLTALGILAKSRVKFRRQSKTPFLLLAVALLVTDLGSHVIPGTFALYLHIGQTYKTQRTLPTGTFCRIFGASMVFFGLCPLLLGCAMAMERCVGITQPLFHSTMITIVHMRRVVLFLASIALVLAIPPFFGVGTYTAQFPGTWCFLPVNSPHSTADTSLALVFSFLGLTALTLSLLCNILSGLALLLARMRSYSVNTKSAAHSSRRASSASTSFLFCSLDVEMMVQLAAITVMSCVCWSPFLVSIGLFTVASIHKQDKFILLALRLASWNQILDPWVYILLRRAVLFRVRCTGSAHGQTETARRSFTGTRRPTVFRESVAL
uniref:Thromboxane A2 receptor n=1 Tax=Mastacembelus armatus TaxID=205130 RepID=A0A7N8XF20_9TELE